MTLQGSPFHELDELLERLCEKRLDHSGRVRLNAMLRESAECRARYFQYVDLHTSLWWSTAEPSARSIGSLRGEISGNSPAAVADSHGSGVPGKSGQSPADGETESALPRIRVAPLRPGKSGGQYWHRHPVSFWSIVSALTLLLGAGFFLVWRGPFAAPDSFVARPDAPDVPVPNGLVATLTAVIDPVWGPEGNVQHFGGRLRAGARMVLKSGVGEITFDDGAVVWVEGPVNFTIQAGGAGLLERGRLHARVPRRATGFAIDTPGARIIDRGTEFGVQVDEDSRAEVQVYQGRVELATKKAGGRAVFLDAGSAMTVERTGHMRPAARRAAFVSKLPAQHPGAEASPSDLSGTILTFHLADPDPENIPIPQTYGDNVSAATQVGPGHTFHYGGGNGFTPNVTVSYEHSGGDLTQFNVWSAFGAWQGGVGYLNSSRVGEGVYYDIIFTPQAGYGVRVNRFVLDDWARDRHTVNWKLYRDAAEPENLLAGADEVVVQGGENRLIETGVSEFHADRLVLRILHTAGGGDQLAIDDVHFEQVALPAREE